MAKIDLRNLGITFTVRHFRGLTLKEFLVRRMFRSEANPRIQVQALSNINLHIGEGERVGIIGHNGAGKSTLLKAIAGVYCPTTGVREIEGDISSLFDIQLGFEMDSDGWENIAYRSYLQGETPKTLQPKIQSIAEFTELGEHLNMPVRFYSAGMLTRLAFAIATAIEPEILLVDEVFGAGDLAFQKKARERMFEMIDKARIVVMVGHDLVSLRSVCNRVVWISQGQIVQDGDADEVITAYHKYMTQRTASPAPQAA